MAAQTKNEVSARSVRENSVGWMLKILGGSLDAEMSEKLGPLGLNLGQFAVLMTLLEEEGLTQRGIGDQIGMPGYATTRNIDKLEQKQFVERRRDERSRRSHRIYLTRQGRALAPELFTSVAAVNKRLLSVLTEDERKLLTAILAKMVQSRLPARK